MTTERLDIRSRENVEMREVLEDCPSCSATMDTLGEFDTATNTMYIICDDCGDEYIETDFYDDWKEN